MALPPHWHERKSKSNDGRVYYFNTVLKRSSWKLPLFRPCSSECISCRQYKKNVHSHVKEKPLFPKEKNISIGRSLYKKRSMSSEGNPKKKMKVNSSQDMQKDKFPNKSDVRSLSAKQQSDENGVTSKVSSENYSLWIKSRKFRNQSNSIYKQTASKVIKKYKKSAKRKCTEICNQSEEKRKYIKISHFPQKEKEECRVFPAGEMISPTVENISEHLIHNQPNTAPSSDEIKSYHYGNEEMEVDAVEFDQNKENLKQQLQGAQKLPILTCDNTSYSNPESANFIYFVVDTNIMISELNLVESICKKHFKDHKIIVIIPYAVIAELDGLKNKSSKAKQVRQAIHWCSKKFSGTDSNYVRGQSYANHLQNERTFHGQNADDQIRDCCLHIRNNLNLPVLLLTNDCNLRNKALLSDIEAKSAQEIKIEFSSSLIYATPTSSCNSSSSKEMFSSMLPQPQSVKTSNELSTEFPSKHNLIGYISESKTLDSLNSSNCSQSSPHAIHRKTSKRKSENHERINDITDYSTLSSNNNNSILSSQSSSSPQCNTVSIPETVAEWKLSLKTTLSNILVDFMFKIYGENWIHVVKRQPPWTLMQVIDCWEKHWRAIFFDKFGNHVSTQLSFLRTLCGGSHVNSNQLEKEVLKFYELLVINKEIKEKVVLPPNKCSSDANNSSTIPIYAEQSVTNTSIEMESNREKEAVEDKNAGQMEPARYAIIYTGRKMFQCVADATECLQRQLTDEQRQSVRTPVETLSRCIWLILEAMICCRDDPSGGAALAESLSKFWFNAREKGVSIAGPDVLRLLEHPLGPSFLDHCIREIQSIYEQLMIASEKFNQFTSN